MLLEPQPGDYGAARVVVPSPEDPRFAHLAWPKLARTADGTLVLACCAGVSHTRSACPAVSVSIDDGRTFTPPNVLVERARGLRLKVSAEVGARTLTVEDLLALRAGSSIDLRRTVTEPLELRAGGRLIARGDAVVLERGFGLRLRGR